MTDFLADAQESLNEVRGIVSGLGLKHVDIDPMPIGVGIGVAWGDTDFIVLSIGAANAGWLYLTSGVVRDIRQERLAALDLCNSTSHNNPAFNYLLHDADLGWDVIVQQTFPIQLLRDVPPFLNMTLESVPASARENRPSFIEAVGGVAHRWGEEDVRRLLQRSLL